MFMDALNHMRSQANLRLEVRMRGQRQFSDHIPQGKLHYEDKLGERVSFLTLSLLKRHHCQIDIRLIMFYYTKKYDRMSII